MANPNPVTPFVEKNTYGSRPRKRRVASEAELNTAFQRFGAKSLIFYEDIISGEKKTGNDGKPISIEAQIQAANAWTKLVFIQSKDGEDNEQNQRIMAEMALVSKRLIEKGHDVSVLKDLYEIMEEISESQKEEDESPSEDVDV